MPNFRALSQMPADGGDLVRAIREDSAERAEVRDYIREYPEEMREPTKREMSLIAFERGNHAPPEMAERKPEAVKRGGWVMHKCTDKSVCPVMPTALVWVVLDDVGVLSRRAASDWIWHSPSYIVAYSTDTECPPWPAEA